MTLIANLSNQLFQDLAKLYELQPFVKVAPNAITKDLRECITIALENTSPRLEKALANLDDKEFVAAWAKLSEYVLPELQRTETTFDLSKLSEAEVETLFEMAMKKTEQ